MSRLENERESLREIFRKLPSSEIRENVRLKAHGAIANEIANLISMGHISVEVLGEFFSDPDPEVRLSAISSYSLVEADRPDLNKQLYQVEEEDESKAVRLAAERARQLRMGRIEHGPTQRKGRT